MTNSASNDAAIAIVLIGAVFFIVAWTYFYHARHYDRTWTRLLVSRRLGWLAVFMAFSLGLNLVDDYVGKQVANLIAILFLVIFAGVSLVAIVRRRKRVIAVLDLGVVQGTPEALVALVSLGAFCFFIAALVEAEHRETLLMLSGGCVLFAGLGAVSRQAHTVFNDTGIYIGDNALTWQRIQRFTWAGGQNDPMVLMVQIMGRVPPFDLEEIRIPAAQRDAVEQFISIHVAGV